MINLELAKKEFENYTSKYDMNVEEIMLKHCHSFRVSDLCIQIATDLKLGDEDIQLAGLIGLLHDIGRFEQVKKYNTFTDSESIDHAYFGSMLLFEQHLIRTFVVDTQYDEIIKKAIFIHNKYAIYDEYSEREKLFSKIVRDADKLDILDIFARKEYMIKSEKRGLSDLVFNEMMNNRQIKYNEVISKDDSYMLTLSQIYDINFRYSYKLVKDNDYISKIVSTITDNYVADREKIDKIVDNINNYIKQKIGGSLDAR